MAEMSALQVEDLIRGTDGCSAPVYALPLRNFAFAVARLCDPTQLNALRQTACRKITHAMMSYPELIAGPGKLDTLLMQVMQGKAVVKGGAEGYQMIGLMPGALKAGSPGIGIAIKFSDGDPSRRATDTFVTALLRAFGFQQERLLKDCMKSRTNFAQLARARDWRTTHQPYRSASSRSLTIIP